MKDENNREWFQMTDAVETEEIDYTYANGKPATPLQRRFAEWLTGEEVGYDPAKAKTKAEAFAEGVRYAVALRIPFQASAANREATAVEREEREVARIEAREAKEAARAEKASAAQDKAAAKAAKATEEPEAKLAKATPARKAKAATPAPTPAVAPKSGRPAARRAPARAAAPAADAPF